MNPKLPPGVPEVNQVEVGGHRVILEADYGKTLGARVVVALGPLTLPLSSDEARTLARHLTLAAAHADHLSHGDKQQALWRL